MKVDGRAISRNVSIELKKKIARLENKGVIPHLVIILVGNDEASKSYIRQKIKKAGEIGIRVTYKRFPKNTSEKTLLSFVDKQNADPLVHGIIIQRPVPGQIHPETIKSAVTPEKDVDGFHEKSSFEPPLALAVMRILQEIFMRATKTSSSEIQSKVFLKWLTSQNIVFLGRGEAGGKPVISHVEKLGVKHSIIHSKTESPESMLARADIIISAVGKKEVVKPDVLKKGIILIGIGLHKEADSKLHGDYEEESIKDIAAYYTPTPGGVGPVNVAMLLQNVITAAQSQPPL